MNDQSFMVKSSGRRSSSIAYRREIDGLRALAVLAVIMFHAGFGAFSGGYVGVDVFFVISGYLITSLIIAEKDAGTFSLAEFYERRARRILPALFVVLIASSLFGWFWLLPGDLKLFSQSLIAVSLFLSNVYFFMRTGYFDQNFLFPLVHTWSLAVEEQYYLIFPLLLLLLWKLSRKWIYSVMLVIALASLLAAELSLRHHQEFAFYLAPTRAWELLIGVLAAIYCASVQGRPGLHRAGNDALAIVGLGLIVGSIVLFDANTPFPGLFALIPTLGALLIIMFGGAQTMVGKVLGTPVLVGVGLISYSAYLWHEPMFTFARQFGYTKSDPLVFAGLAALSLVLAYATWRFVEVPFRNRKHFSRNAIFCLASLGTLAFIGFGTLGYASNGFAHRIAPRYLPADYLLYAAQNVRRLNGIDGHMCISASASMCRLNVAEAAEKILLVGDSHSGDYTFEFHNFIVSNGLNGWQMSVGGCEFFASQAEKRNGQCGKARALLEHAIHQEHFNEILLVGDFYAATDQNDPSVLSGNIQSFAKMVNTMLADGAKVIFFSPRYHLSEDPMRAAFNGRLNAVHVVADTDTEQWLTAIDQLRGNKNFKIFEEGKVLLELGCGRTQCFNGHTGARLPLYEDTDHLTDYGAKEVFKRFLALRNSVNEYYY